MVTEAELDNVDYGLVPTGSGWYVLNAQKAAWFDKKGRGFAAALECRSNFDQLGVSLYVLQPGEPMAMYHWETDQEDFLVVSGEALLIVESEERPLRRWDFVHCPPQTKHVIVGAGSGPCLVIAVGARARSSESDSLGFTVDEVAKRHRASVVADTMDGGIAYASVPPRGPTAYRDGWLPASLSGS